jgi:hypothetical protein
MVNSDQIKLLMKEVCTVFVSITKCVLRLGGMTITPRSLIILNGMARPQVEDGGTASNVESSCEYIE